MIWIRQLVQYSTKGIPITYMSKLSRGISLPIPWNKKNYFTRRHGATEWKMAEKQNSTAAGMLYSRTWPMLRACRRCLQHWPNSWLMTQCTLLSWFFHISVSPCLRVRFKKYGALHELRHIGNQENVFTNTCCIARLGIKETLTLSSFEDENFIELPSGN